MASDVRIAVTLACTECKRRNYQTNKSKRNDPERIELRKVQWPTRRHLWQASAVVVVVTVVLGVYIALLDSVFTKVASWLIDQYAAH